MTDLHERLLSGLPVRARKLHLHGVTTSVLEGGEGPPVVLLHGPNEYGAKWLRVLPTLAATHRVIAPDLPGHGRSGAFDGAVDTERVLAWLDALIEGTCSAPPVLCGHILGGAIAARYAASPSHALSRLVLVDALGLTNFQPVPEFGQALSAFLSEPSEATHDGLWRYCAFDLEKLQTRMGDTWSKLKAYNLDRAKVPALKATQHALMEHFGFPAIPTEELDRIAVPTSLIWGRHDLATPLSVAQAASARLRWPLFTIDACADDPPIEQPEAFVRALYAALEK